MNAKQSVVRITITAALLLVIVSGSHFPYSGGRDDGLLRYSLLLPGSVRESCRKLTEQEIASLPMHMRRPEVCETSPLKYRLKIVVNGETLEETVTDPNHQQKETVFLSGELPLAIGTHELSVELSSDSPEQSRYRAHVRQLPVSRNQIVLLTLKDGELTIR